MCIPTKLQQNIISLTKDGHAIAKFLVNTMQGETPGVKVCHRMEATKHLIKYGFPDADCETTSDRLSRAGGNPERQGEGANTPSPSTGEDWDGGEDSSSSMSASISHLDILNYEIAHLIRHETADGHTLVEFLIHIMTGRDRPFTPRKFRIKPADRMAAARELLRRGFGDFGRKRKLSDNNDEANAYDALHTDLAKRMREYSERGADAIRFLLEVMANPDPEEGFTVHHRMSAAQELLRRGWDTNYDNIKPECLTDYWRDKESARLSVGQKKTQAGLSTSIDDYDNYDDTDYEAIAQEMKEEEDCQAASKSRHSRAGGNPEGQGEAANNPPLPQGEGWGEGNDNSRSPRRSKSLPPAKAEVTMGVKNPAQSPLPNKATTVNEQDKAIIKVFQEAMASGDHRAAIRAKAKFIGRKVVEDLQPYVAPDPNLQPYNRPFDKEVQAKFDEEPPPPIAATGYPGPEMQIADAAPNGASVICAPPAEKLRAPAIRSP